MPQYRYLVETMAGNNGRLYAGDDRARAVAAWDRALAGGAECVTLEAVTTARPLLPSRGAALPTPYDAWPPAE